MTPSAPGVTTVQSPGRGIGPAPAPPNWPTAHAPSDRPAAPTPRPARALPRWLSPAALHGPNRPGLVGLVLVRGRGGGMDGRARRVVLYRVGGLLEKERRFTGRIGAHFPRVRRIVASDAIDAPHRKELAAAGDRDERRRDSERHARLRHRTAGQRVACDTSGGKRARATQHLSALSRRHAVSNVPSGSPWCGA